MSESVGPLSLGQKEEQIFLGKELTRHRDYSERTAIMIDDEISKIVTENYERAHRIILENQDTVNRIADALLERESLDAAQVEAIIEGKDLPKLESESGKSSSGGQESTGNKTGEDQPVIEASSSPDPEKA